MDPRQPFHAGYLVRWQLGDNEQSITNTSITIKEYVEVNAENIYEVIEEVLAAKEGLAKSFITILGVFKLY